MTNYPEAFTVADRLFDSIEAGDVDAVADLYHADLRVWHNTDGIEQTRQENLDLLRWLVANLAGRRYEDVRRIATETGFAQQHVLRGTGPNGAVAIPAAFFAVVEDGLITRIDEYLDSGQIGALLQPPVAAPVS